MEPILKGRNLVKRYGKVTALDHCDFDLMPGEILAVIGDNGAGKSTLIKAVSGAVAPDEGDVWLEGQKVNFHSPIDAREAGIETVYQTLAMSLPCRLQTICSWVGKFGAGERWDRCFECSTALPWKSSLATN